MKNIKKIGPVIGLLVIAIITLSVTSHFSKSKLDQQASVGQSQQSHQDKKDTRLGVFCNETWCDDHSDTSIQHKLFTYNYDAALEAMKNAGAPQYTTSKNKDGSTSFYLNGQLVVGDSKPGSCTMFNPDPTDSSKGTYIQSDAPACVTPGVSYGTVKFVTEEHHE